MFRKYPYINRGDIMAYSIRYGPIYGAKRQVRYCSGWQILTAAVALATICGVSRWWQAGRDVLAQWLLPLELTPVERALQTMAGSIAAGEGWYVGAVAFCRMLLA